MVKKLLKFLIVIIFLCFVNSVAFADQPPDPGGGPGGTDPPVGGGAPIGGGLVITMALAAAYGTRKIIAFNDKK